MLCVRTQTERRFAPPYADIDGVALLLDRHSNEPGAYVSDRFNAVPIGVGESHAVLK